MTAVLFTCAGQRVDIVSAFGRAGATTVAADLDPLAPALYHADHRALVPSVRDPRYVDALARLVAEHDVRLVVPLTDLDQEVVSAARDALEPALVLAPAPDVCRTMGDKYLAHAFFESHGIPSPRTWLPEDVPDDVRYPVLVKVREGFGSRHIYRADDAGQLECRLEVHAPQAGVGVGASDDRHVQGAGQAQIVEVGASTLQESGVLDPLSCRADLTLRDGAHGPSVAPGGP